jgi:hypothetical protein
VTTDRRTYMIELRAGEKPLYAGRRLGLSARRLPAAPDRSGHAIIPGRGARNYRYGLTGEARRHGGRFPS